MADKGYLITGNKSECLGCEACVQVCAHAALVMKEDSEGFRYPVLDKEACVDCGLCHRVCPIEQPVEKNNTAQKGFGGYALDEETRCASTSGGAFSCIVESWCKENYVVFGAVADGLDVYHTYVTDKNGIGVFRKSKYLQSRIGKSYREAAEFLKEGKYVLFSGTPCQIAGLYNYLLARKNDVSRLLTVEVVCEGVPTPLYVRKLDDGMMEKYGSRISDLDYRFKDGKFDYNAEKQGVRRKGKWDFQVMRVVLENGKKLKKDRWLNPFWSIWLNHLINRPSCYECPYATRKRVSDITLGDLWGVHLYCPELYGENGGASVLVSNTEKGESAMQEAEKHMYGHSLDMDDVVRYQGPMRKCVALNPLRDKCMADLKDPAKSYSDIVRLWAKRPGLKLLYSKYVWGNRQKVAFWNLKKKIFRK